MPRIEDVTAAMALRKGDKVVRVAGVDDSIGTVVGIHEQRVDLLAPLGAIRSYDITWRTVHTGSTRAHPVERDAH